MSNTVFIILLALWSSQLVPVADRSISDPTDIRNGSISDSLPHGQLQTLVAKEDYTQVSEDVSVRIPVLRNDQLNGDLKTAPFYKISLGKQGLHGLAVVDTVHNHIIYRPYQNFYGSDTLTYQVCSDDAHCDQTQVYIQVHNVNDMPIINDDEVVLDEDSWIVIDPIANDHDTMDNQLMDASTLKVVEAPRYGLLAVEDMHKIRYTPTPDYFGGDFFAYTVCESSEQQVPLCDTAMVYIQVTNINDPPIAIGDFDTTYQNLPTVIDIKQNDYDQVNERSLPNGLDISLEGLPIPMHGTLFLDETVDLVIYTPPADFIGVDSFSYLLCDFGPGKIMCDTGSVVVTVLPPFQTD